MNQDIDIQGHRGCRGLIPENTVMAFKKAMDIGCKYFRVRCRSQ